MEEGNCLGSNVQSFSLTQQQNNTQPIEKAQLRGLKRPSPARDIISRHRNSNKNRGALEILIEEEYGNCPDASFVSFSNQASDMASVRDAAAMSQLNPVNFQKQSTLYKKTQGFNHR